MTTKRQRSMFTRPVPGSPDLVAVFHEDGHAVTRLEANVYPWERVGDDDDGEWRQSRESVRYEHPRGVVLTRSDAQHVGLAKAERGE